MVTSIQVTPQLLQAAIETLYLGKEDIFQNRQTMLCRILLTFDAFLLTETLAQISIHIEKKGTSTGK